MKSLILALLLISPFAQANLEVEIAAPEAEAVETLNRQFLSYDFGFVPVHQTRTSAFRVRNTGSVNLTFRDAMIWGMAFDARHNCNRVLRPAETCHFEIRYWPRYEARDSGRFRLSFREGSEIHVDLWGRGTRY